MVKAITNELLPLDREAILFSEDEDHGPLEVYLSELVRTLEELFFDVTQVINLNDAPPFTTKTDDYTLVQTDKVILADASGGAFTLTLPRADLSPAIQFDIKKIDITANIVTIDPNGSETIDGDANMTLLSKDETVRIYCTGDTRWFIL